MCILRCKHLETRSGMTLNRLYILFMSLCLITGLFLSCKKDVRMTCDLADQQLYEAYNFPIGAAVQIDKINSNSDYNNIVLKQFNSLTSENAMKFDAIHPVFDTYNWEVADQLVDFAMLQDKKVHGHTLIWDQQLPNWLLNFQGSQTEWEDVFRNHIKNVVSHYQSKIESWDVVNEAFDEKGNLKENIWQQQIGDDYIEKAFTYAHEANPQAKLFYNDFNLAQNNRKKNAVLKLCQTLKEKNIPIHGVGFQMHINIHTPVYSEIKSHLNDFANEGLLVRISELDISINPLSRDIETASERKLRAQAEKMLAVFKAYCTLPGNLQHGITIWGISDQDSWIPGYFNRVDFPLMFDSNYQPKPAYCSIVSSNN